MAAEITVRKARLKDAGMIATFINQAQLGAPVDRLQIAERFSQVGFLIAEQSGKMIGFLGWQVENLVVRVTDFLLGPEADWLVVGQMLIKAMEVAGQELQAEAGMLFMPHTPSQALLDFWAHFEYQPKAVTELPKAWRQAAAEWNREAASVVVKQLRAELVRRPI